MQSLNWEAYAIKKQVLFIFFYFFQINKKSYSIIYSCNQSLDKGEKNQLNGQKAQFFYILLERR